MKKIYNLFLGSLLLFAVACDNDLEQFPDNIASADSLTDFSGVLNAAYFYQHGSVTPLAVMGDFRADNAKMFEEPYPEFDRFDDGLTIMEDQFFGPFYTALYKSILSANNVISNSSDATDVGEAKFLRALSYFKLVKVFGGVPVNLSDAPVTNDLSIFERQPANDIYNSIIIPDLTDAVSVLGTSIVNGRASKYAAQGLLGKVYIQMGNFIAAESHLAAVVNGASSAGISLQSDFTNIFGVDNDLNSEIIFSTQISSSINDEYGFSEFWTWYGGLDTKSEDPLDADLIAAFDAVSGDVIDATVGDLRRLVTIDETTESSPKFPQIGGADHDWIELRLADIILLYAETLNENNNSNGSQSSTILGLLDDIRTRAGLNSLVGSAITQADVRQAIQDERRLELAFEGQRWFDLVRTGTVDAEMGEVVNSNYYLFPIPISEILATDGVITQNPGY